MVEQEWIEEMAVRDQRILDALFKKVILDIPEYDPEHNASKHVQEVSKLVAILLGQFVFEDGKKENTYDARLRDIFRRLITHLMSKDELEHKEATLIMSMSEMQAVQDATKFADEMEVKRQENAKPDYIRWAKMGAITVGGGLLVGVTGGLAAPAMAAGLGTLAGSLGIYGAGATLAAMGSVAGSAIIGSVLGVTGAGMASYNYNKRSRDLNEFEFVQLSNPALSSMSYIIAISGWLPTKDSGPEQWDPILSINPLTELFLLHYEREYLVDLTTAAQSFLKANIISYGASTAAAFTSAAGFAFAAAFPLVAIRATVMIDNPWLQALKKSEQAGRLLAKSVLAQFVGGRRPVTLIGHGMGARVIYFCLLELFYLKDEVDVYGIIDNIYFLGGSIAPCVEDWNRIAPLVSGRLVNCFSTNDWFLKILFRLNLSPCAGANAVDIPGVENIDVSEIIGSHEEYITKRDEILKVIGFENML
jgi:hypothetical protein